MKLFLPITTFFVLSVGASAEGNLRPVSEGRNLQEGQETVEEWLSKAKGPPEGSPAYEPLCDSYEDNKASGLCIAYHRKDCDTEVTPPCSKLRANFLEITGTPMPVDCPCLNGGVEGWGDALASVDGDECAYTPFGPGSISFRTAAIATAIDVTSACGNDLRSGECACGFLDRGSFMFPRVAPLIITPEQAENCYTTILSVVERFEVPYDDTPGSPGTASTNRCVLP